MSFFREIFLQTAFFSDQLRCYFFRTRRRPRSRRESYVWYINNIPHSREPSTQNKDILQLLNASLPVELNVRHYASNLICLVQAMESGQKYYQIYRF